MIRLRFDDAIESIGTVPVFDFTSVMKRSVAGRVGIEHIMYVIGNEDKPADKIQHPRPEKPNSENLTRNRNQENETVNKFMRPPLKKSIS